MFLVRDIYDFSVIRHKIYYYPIFISMKGSIIEDIRKCDYLWHVKTGCTANESVNASSLCVSFVFVCEQIKILILYFIV